MRAYVKPVFQAWLDGKDKTTATLSSIGGKIVSYKTPLLWRDEDGSVVYNDSLYSRTTSGQQTSIRVLLAEHGIEYKTVDGIRRGY
jgi:hypothetical protein